ncbi:MAG: ABC transporter ATP-binding protein [Thiotrichales bacterium]|nr:MAG: ABC transporter ATP-binding protein [Thiotrichales bacterium]
MPEEAPVIEISNLRFAWKKRVEPVLSIASLQVNRGERVFLRGPSGSGKSSLLNLLAGVALPQSGRLKVLGQDMTALSSAQRDHFRAHHIGFIFQMFNLIPYLSVVENVTLPCRFSKKRKHKVLAQADSQQDEAIRLLGHLDMAQADVLHKPVSELSVGQQQRVAAARALIGSPELVIADEPTSSLDADRRTAFIDLLFRECDSANATLIFVSHDNSLVAPFERTIEFHELNHAASNQQPMLKAVT